MFGRSSFPVHVPLFEVFYSWRLFLGGSLWLPLARFIHQNRRLSPHLLKTQCSSHMSWTRGRYYCVVCMVRVYTQYTHSRSPSSSSSFLEAHSWMVFCRGWSLNTWWAQYKEMFPCLALVYGISTQSLCKLKNTREQATLFPWSGKLQPPCAVHIKYQSRPPLLPDQNPAWSWDFLKALEAQLCLLFVLLAC